MKIEVPGYSAWILQRSWALHLLAAGSCIAIGCLVWQLQLAIHRWTEAMVQEAETMQRLVAAAEGIRTQHAQAVDIRRQASVAYRRSLERIPQTLTEADVLEGLRRLADETGCSLFDFRPGNSERVEGPEQSYQLRSLQLHLKGDFARLFHFLDQLQASPFLVQVQRFQLDDTYSADGTYSVDLEIGVVFHHRWKQNDNEPLSVAVASRASLAGRDTWP
jgi:hypothetical protein